MDKLKHMFFAWRFESFNVRFKFLACLGVLDKFVVKFVAQIDSILTEVLPSFDLLFTRKFHMRITL